jgi:hypothetical protein
MTDDIKIVHQTIGFLRMAGVELRRLADLEPNIAGMLRHTADQCDSQANDLATHFDAPPALSQTG